MKRSGKLASGIATAASKNSPTGRVGQNIKKTVKRTFKNETDQSSSHVQDVSSSAAQKRMTTMPPAHIAATAAKCFTIAHQAQK